MITALITEAVTEVTTAAAEDKGFKIFLPDILKFAGFCFVIMTFIYIIAVLTPNIAKKVDKILEKNKKIREDRKNDGVRGIYDLPPVMVEDKKTEEDNSESENKENK